MSTAELPIVLNSPPQTSSPALNRSAELSQVSNRLRRASIGLAQVLADALSSGYQNCSMTTAAPCTTCDE
jgi:hypothetical protein